MYPFFFLDQGAGGFAPDFVQMAMAPNIKHIKSKGKLKLPFHSKLINFP